jgi:hypothetical protein
MRYGGLGRWPMPDWQKAVREQLAGLNLGHAEEDEVIAELAGHLEETYEALRRDGLPEREAVRQSLLQVRNWSDLRRNIYCARVKENTMNPRTSRLWLPSLVTLAASFITLVAFGFLGLQPGPLGSRPHHEEWSSHIITGIAGGRDTVNEYTVWLMVLPFVGALGARLSSRAGGTLRDIVISGVFPALAWLTIVLIVLSFAASLGPGVETLMAPVGPLGLITLLVLIPGAGLLIGVVAYSVVTKWRRKLAG